ncbi:hypothetical protein [Mesorhizobium sp.]|uniref:hypothetical protein n=2 Tax=Mesorhizobium sp. TaxID=1871066 RepID=UPI00351A3D3E
MRMTFLLVTSATMMATVVAHADSQSSNTSSNSSSNNGVVRERIVETYCEDDYCETYVKRRVYQDDRSSRRYQDYDRRRYRDRYTDDDDDD